MSSAMLTRTRRRPSANRSGMNINTARRRSSRIHSGEKEELCPCGIMEVGGPMLRCGECHRWYHFRCADLTERDAEELAYYICPACATLTGKKSREHWELDDTEIAALPNVEEHEQSPSPSSDDEAGSEDNFVAEPEEVIPVEDPPSDHSDEGIATRIHKRGARKRKSVSKQIEASAKRHKTTESTVPSPPPGTADDPIRKSCLEILVKLLAPIFSERLPDEPEPPAHAVGVDHFATELEACIFEIYGDQTDFDGKIPGNKYKERVRMLNFNLGKKDRKELRQSIRVGRISPDELSRMSSIDLANSQAQQEAHKLAEEAMNHSILQVRTAPLRKITHKGEQVIEQSQEEENWRIQEEAAQERERELQRSRSNTIGSANDGDKPRVWSLSDSYTGVTESEAASGQAVRPPEKAFDPASAVFSVDFDGDGPTLHEHGPPTPPGLSGEPTTSVQGVLGDGLQMASPTSTSVSPLAQNFSLDGIFGSSEPTTSMWNNIRESEGSVSAHSHMGDDTVAPPDDADFDAFITVDEDEVPRTTLKEEPVASALADPPLSDHRSSLAHIKTIWRGHVGMPSMSDPSRMIQFQSDFKQVAGAPFHDIDANRKSLFPASLFEIIGRVPTSQAINYLVSMRLNPTKELFACVLAPNEDDKAAYFELHRILLGKDRYGLVFPWGQDPPLSAPGKELYIAPLLPEHPIPEYLQLLDNVNIPAKRDGPIFCGIFVLSKGRVTTLDSDDIPHPTPLAPMSSVPLPTPIPASSVTIAGIPPVLPIIGSSLSNLSQDSIATLSKDLANLTPSQLELVRSLLIQQPAPAVVPAAQPLAPIPPPLATPHLPVPSRRPPHQGSGPGPSGSLQPGPSPARSPAHTGGPLHWDRPRASYPEHGWEPGPGPISGPGSGPGPVRYGRDEYTRDEFTRDDFRRDDFRRDEFRRDDYCRDDFGRDDFGREDFGRNEFPREDFRRDEFRRDDFRRDDFIHDDFGREPRDDWPPFGRHDTRDDRPTYRGRGGGSSRHRGRGRGGPPTRW
ncbi:transcription factor S-II, central domain-containing protein [Rhizoctonia solani]|nr:transcription factor S-II, central domain-containing protein [Rhizoctonia solani]